MAYDNRMFPQGFGMPQQGPMQGGINPQFLQQLQQLQQMQGMGPQGGMQALPMGAPMPPPGWQGGAQQAPPEIYGQMGGPGGQGGVGWAQPFPGVTQRPMQAPPGWRGQLGGGMEAAPQSAPMPPQGPRRFSIPVQAQPGQGGQRPNKAQVYSGRNNPFDQPAESAPAPTTRPMEPAGTPTDVMTKPKPISGSPPFNPGPLSSPATNQTPPTQPNQTESLWQGRNDERMKRMKGDAAMRKLSGALAR